ncbi:hypothetical protein ACFTSF_08420 [Kribbella sp. NPDC056951]|uniref:hypothetical protein n=1 Tax=Kribbella sp. NPDC056951 TaxID=3345978 RepID=UPI0036266138
MTAAGRHSGRISRAALAEHEQLNRHLWTVFALSTSKAPMFPVVRAQLDVLTAAREAASPDLWACALTRHAYICIYEGAFAQAEPLLQHAAVVARSGDPQLATRHWVSSVQSQALAGLGDSQACLRAIDRAAGVRELTISQAPSGWLRFDGSRLAEEHGACLASLREAEAADVALTQALEQNLSLRRRGAVLTDLASTGVLLRDTERVIRYGEAALDVALESWSGVVRRKLLDFRQSLGQIPEGGSVHDLSRRIEALETTVAG